MLFHSYDKLLYNFRPQIALQPLRTLKGVNQEVGTIGNTSSLWIIRTLTFTHVNYFSREVIGEKKSGASVNFELSRKWNEVSMSHQRMTLRIYYLFICTVLDMKNLITAYVQPVLCLLQYCSQYYIWQAVVILGRSCAIDNTNIYKYKDNTLLMKAVLCRMQ